MNHLYIHIPFCKSKCHYCDFLSYAEKYDYGAYLNASLREVDARANEQPQTLLSIYIGGGTPSLMPKGFIASLLGAVKRRFDVAPDAEISIEANPGTLCENKLFEYLACGVNRLSIGFQSLEPDLLRTLGRAHSPEDAVGSFEMARRAGFSNVNVDVMYGLPGQSAEAFLRTLRSVIELSPGHISAYALTLSPASPLTRMLGEREAPPLPDEDECAKMADAVNVLLKEHGFIHYEVSNYAKPGYECRHNLNTWSYGEYMAIGCGAHGFIREGGKRVRYENISGIREYIEKAGSGNLPEARHAEVPARDAMFESIMLGLRMIEGISFEAFYKLHGINLMDVYKTPVESLIARGLLEHGGAGIRATARGMELLNTLLVEFM